MNHVDVEPIDVLTQLLRPMCVCEREDIFEGERRIRAEGHRRAARGGPRPARLSSPLHTAPHPLLSSATLMVWSLWW